MENKMKEKLLDNLEKVGVSLLVLFVVQMFPRGNLDQYKDIVDLVAPLVVAIFIILIPLLIQSLKRNVFRPGLSLLPQGIVKPDRFALSWQQSVLFGALIFIGAIELVSSIAGFIIAYFFGQISIDQMFLGLIPVGLIASWIIAFGIGRWIGMRVYHNGFSAMVTVIIVGHLVVALIDVGLLPALIGETIPLSNLLDPISLGLLATRVIFGAFGYWRGKKARNSAYLGYLTNELPFDTQRAIVELVYEEVQSTSNTSRLVHSTPASST